MGYAPYARTIAAFDEIRRDMELLILFTDKKLFTIQSVHNTQNDRILAKNKKDIALEDWALFRRQKPQYVMVRAWVTTDYG